MRRRRRAWLGRSADWARARGSSRRTGQGFALSGFGAAPLVVRIVPALIPCHASMPSSLDAPPTAPFSERDRQRLVLRCQLKVPRQRRQLGPSENMGHETQGDVQAAGSKCRCDCPSPWCHGAAMATLAARSLWCARRAWVSGHEGLSHLAPCALVHPVAMQIGCPFGRRALTRGVCV